VCPSQEKKLLVITKKYFVSIVFLITKILERKVLGKKSLSKYCCQSKEGKEGVCYDNIRPKFSLNTLNVTWKIIVEAIRK